MNFDIKYTRNLKRMNFIKIKQGLCIFLGTQNWGSKANDIDDSGCKLETSNRQTDM